MAIEAALAEFRERLIEREERQDTTSLAQKSQS